MERGDELAYGGGTWYIGRTFEELNNDSCI